MWNQHTFPPGPSGAPGMHAPVHESRPAPAPIDPSAAEKEVSPPLGAPTGPKALARVQTPNPDSRGPPPPIDSKPSVAQVEAIAETLNELSQETPAVPIAAAAPASIPATRTDAPAAKAVSTTATTTRAIVTNPAGSIADATETAKAAVAKAMAQLRGSPTGSAVDNLTKRVNAMRVDAARSYRGNHVGRGGRGRGGRPPNRDIVDSTVDIAGDYNFDEANTKFNKAEVFKRVESSVVNDLASAEGGKSQTAAYDKKISFFDTIGSEAAKNQDRGGWWNEESRNIETFGQGQVDGSYTRRGRGYGRGRGYRGRGGPRNVG